MPFWFHIDATLCSDSASNTCYFLYMFAFWLALRHSTAKNRYAWSPAIRFFLSLIEVMV